MPLGLLDEERLTEDIIELTREFGRYGYRMITGMLNKSGWHVNHRRVEWIWRREGLKVPQKQAKKGRLWLNDGSGPAIGIAFDQRIPGGLGLSDGRFQVL